MLNKNNSASLGKKPDTKPCFYVNIKKAILWSADKEQIVREYFGSAASMSELSELYGILGSNTVADWLRKYGNLSPSKLSNPSIMSKPHAPAEDKQKRQRRYSTDEQLRVGELESGLEAARQKVRFYCVVLDLLNEAGKELTAMNLLKKLSPNCRGKLKDRGHEHQNRLQNVGIRPVGVL